MVQIQQPQIQADSTASSLDPQAVNLAKAIRQTESGGNFQAKGKSGEYGAYQFTQPTWDTSAKKYGVNVSLDKATPEQQNEVAYKQIKEWKDAGHNVGEIASLWNSGKANAYLDTSYKGTNKFGANYDVPAYAKSVATAYQTIKNGGQVSTDPNNPSSVVTPQFPLISQKDVQSQTDQNTSNPDLQAGDISAGGEKPINSGFLNSIGGKVAQGLGYAISNATGTQDKFNTALDRGNDIRTNLISQIEKDKKEGKDTSRLEASLVQLNNNLDKGATDSKDVGTGGITNGQVLGSAASLASLPLLDYGTSAIGGLIKGADVLASPAVETGLKGIGVDMPTFQAFNAADKVEALTNIASKAGVADKAVIQQALDKVLPSAINEAGGKVAFSKLYPTTAKLLGLVGKGAGLLFAGSLFEEGGKIAGKAVDTVKGLLNP